MIRAKIKAIAKIKDKLYILYIYNNSILFDLERKIWMLMERVAVDIHLFVKREMMYVCV